MKKPNSCPDLDAAMAAADLRVLLMCLFHLTGDAIWLSSRYQPVRDTSLIPDPQAGLSDVAQHEIRQAATTLLADGIPEPVVGIPPADLFRRMMSHCLGEEVPPEYVPMMYADFGFEAAVERKEESIEDLAQLDVAIIGAGVSGICLASKLQRRGATYTVFERNRNLGGTWFSNRYPGCGVDTPNHFYSYSFRPNPNWGYYFSPREEIQDYLERCAEDFDIRPNIRFDSNVQTAQWDEAAHRWQLSVMSSGGHAWRATARVLIVATGHFARPHKVSIPGLTDFKGAVIHTAEWPADTDLDGRRVGVIGTGASAMQTVPSIVDHVASLTIFQRTPHWCRPEQNYNEPVDPASQWLFGELPFYAKWYRFSEFWRFGDGLLRFLRRDPEWPHGERSLNRGNERHRVELLGYIESELEGRPDLIAKCTPSYPPFGKRMLIDNGWFAALRRSNVELVTDGVERFEAAGVRDRLGTLHEVDTIILATGFDIVDIPALIDIRGKEDVSLAEDWADQNPTAYLGMSVPNFPNLFVMFGPNTNMGHGGSGMWLAETQSEFILRGLGDMAALGATAMEVTEDARSAYTQEVDRRHKELIWAHPGVETYYRNHKGLVRSPMPFRLVDYWTLTKEPDVRHYRMSALQQGRDVPGMTIPRVAPLAPQDRSELAEELLQSVRRPSGEDLNIFATLVRHPKLFRKWLPFGGALLYRGVLEPRHRELLVLRTAWRCGAEYEWGHHVELAEELGLSPVEIEALTAVNIDGHDWTDLENALLTAADELHQTSSIGQETWARLAESFDEVALIEICLLVGHYHTVAFAVNALGIQPE